MSGSERTGTKRKTSFFRKRKDKPVFEIVGTSGVSDGMIVSPKEEFSRSWTILNTSTNTNKEKGKVAKLIHTKGELFVQQLLFLWPSPTKSVTVTINITAPETPGIYESYWKIEGNEEALFWIKFEVGQKEEHKNELSEEDRGSEKKKEKKEKKNSDGEIKKRKKKKLKKKPLMTRRRSKSLSHTGFTPEISKMVHFDSLSSAKARTILTENDLNKYTQSDSESKKSRKQRTKSGNSTELLSRDSFNHFATSDYPELSKFIEKEQIGMHTMNIQKDFEKSGFDPDSSYLSDQTLPKMSASNLLARWHESLVSHASEELTAMEQEKMKNLGEISTATKNIVKTKSKKLMGTNIELVAASSVVKPARNKCKSVTLQSATPPLSNRSLSIPEEANKTFASAPLPSVSPTRSPSTKRHSANPSSLSKISRKPLKASDNSMALDRTIYSLEQFSKITQDLETNLELLTKRYGNRENLLHSINQFRSILHNLSPVANQIQTEVGDLMQGKLTINKYANLEPSIWIKIFSYLPLSDLASISRVCKDWNELSAHQLVWESKYIKYENPEKPLSVVGKKLNAKTLLQIDCLYPNWFSKTCKWKVQQSEAMDAFSFNWPVYGLEIESDTLVTVSDCLRVYDLSKHLIKATLPGHTKVVNSVRLSTNGKSCVTGSVDKTVKIWSLKEYKCLHTLEGHLGPITGVHLLNDIVISTCILDKSVKFWNKLTGECIHTAQFNHGVSCLSLRESEKDDYIYIAKTNGEVSSWNVETQQEISTQQITNGLIEGLQVIDDLIIASDNNRMIVKDFSSNELLCTSPVMKRNIGKLQFDGQKLGAQIGNNLEIYDIRYLFSDYSQITVDNLWKGSFQFYKDSIVIGGGNGKTQKWQPSI